MSRALVTGAAGFIGSHLCDALLARGDDVLGVDCLTDNYSPARKRANLIDALAAGLEFRRLDLSCDPLDPVLKGIDVVYHLAGQPGVRSSWGDDFNAYARRNLLATQRLLDDLRPRSWREPSVETGIPCGLLEGRLSRARALDVDVHVGPELVAHRLELGCAHQTQVSAGAVPAVDAVAYTESDDDQRYGDDDGD